MGSEENRDLDLSAAELRADRAELTTSVEVLASTLEQALPGLVTVERRKVGGFRSKRREVQRVALALGDEQFELRPGPQGVDCTRHKVVRGITLSRNELALSDWLDAVLAGVDASAQVSERDRLALRELLA
jgi:hypothetical protein